MAIYEDAVLQANCASNYTLWQRASEKQVGMMPKEKKKILYCAKCEPNNVDIPLSRSICPRDRVSFIRSGGNYRRHYLGEASRSERSKKNRVRLKFPIA